MGRFRVTADRTYTHIYDVHKKIGPFWRFRFFVVATSQDSAMAEARKRAQHSEFSEEFEL